MDILEIKNVSYSYANSKEKVLSGVNQKFELGKFYAIVGKSGAGKSTALKMLEDARYFCVDNLPIALVGKFVSLMATSQDEEVQNAAIGIDALSGRALEELEVVLDRMKEEGQNI